ncbi:MAG: hypothetical protein M1309_06100 [Actinobacteria bacterium]|nr:hypothetical protein [Actinomycetota bacterium]
MSRNKAGLALTLFLLITLFLTACAQHDQLQGTAGAAGVAGFWSGLWHGLILPVSFIISLFKSNVGVYEVHNSGNWYNFGFVLGIWIAFALVLAPKSSAARRQ